jgi:hypothetical protein
VTAQLHDRLNHAIAECEQPLPPPSANGRNGDATAPSPTANGRNGDATTHSPSANGRNGRAAGGRFAKGNAGGPGNPFGRRTAQLRRVLLEAVSDEDVAAVTRRLVELAKEGDVPAARLLFGYVIGQPAPATDPDQVDFQEMQMYRQAPVAVADLNRILAGVPVDYACLLVRELLPWLTIRAAAKTKEVLLEKNDDEDEPEPPPMTPQEEKEWADGLAELEKDRDTFLDTLLDKPSSTP